MRNNLLSAAIVAAGFAVLGAAVFTPAIAMTLPAGLAATGPVVNVQDYGDWRRHHHWHSQEDAYQGGWDRGHHRGDWDRWHHHDWERSQGPATAVPGYYYPQYQ